VTAAAFTAANPCPICGGHKRLPRGHGKRCHGFLDSTGRYARCSREELAGGIEPGPDGRYPHKLTGKCRCGQTHSEAEQRSRIVATYDYCDEHGKLEQVLFLPYLLWREAAVALVLVAGVTVFAAVVRAPLGPAANPGLSLNPAKAPWYFLGFQELLVHLHPLFAVVILPALGALALVALPYLGLGGDEQRGAWFLSPTGRRTARLAATAGTVSTAVLVLLDDLLLGGAGTPTGDAALLTRGLLPAAGLVAVCVVGFRLLRSRLGATRLEAAQAVFVFLAASFAVLTATGIWFRGAGMKLVWPWNA